MNIVAGVIGCGSIARFHFAALEKLGIRVKWVCDLVEPSARPWAEKFKAAYTADYHAILADPEVNTVFILTISSTHKRMCLDVIAAGKAVICEKTLAENPVDALEIVRQAEARQTIFYTSYMKRFIPAVARAKALLPSIGRIFSTYIRSYQPWGDLWDTNPIEGFFRTPPGGVSPVIKNYGGGILVCGGSHLLDLVGFFLGRPQRVYAAMHQPADRDYDLLASALFETPNGMVHYEAAAHPLTRIGFLRDGWDERIEINATGGRLEIYSALWDKPYEKASLLLHYDNAVGSVTEYRYDPVSPFEREDAFYCANIASGIQGEQARTTGYDVDELIAAIKKSASLHQAVSVDWKTV
jgi:predicted dehydrogenase